MTKIKKYEKKDGSTAYMFKKYLGIDPVTGKQRETTRRGFETKKNAQVALSRIEVDLAENGLMSVKPNRTYEEVFQSWFDNIYVNTVKESTYWNTKLIFDKHILPVLATLKINRINVPFCQQTANQWAEYSPKRYMRFINYAGMVFKYAVSIEEVKSNPMEKIIMPSVEDEEVQDVPNFFERGELINFLNAINKDKHTIRYTFFFLLAYTGLRKGEALALTWRDIDFKQLSLTVNKTLAVGKKGALLIQTPKTKASRRSISIDDDLVMVLKEWQIKQRKELILLGIVTSLDQLIFSTYDNQLMNPRASQSWLDSLYNKNPLMKRITVHGFRHTHASLLFEAKAEPKQVQERLGHTNITTTMNVYAHVTKTSNRETSTLFSNFMKNETSLGQSLGQKKYPLN
ncbi:MAG: tyrosine-type recombinase/integrase [Vagococcus salmoninarum]|uniref:tyrosine-type recombinase/integrase n=1 Tax=Vagococcus salmoninarum TaxID=2739 RepID=UPI003F9A966F